MLIAEPAIAAAQQCPALPGAREVGDHRLAVLGDHLGPDRHTQHKVIAAGTGAVAPRAATTVGRAEMLLIAIVDQRVEIVLRDDDDVAALAAVTAVRPAELDEFLAPKAQRTGATVAALHVDLALVEKFHRVIRWV
jgi:hypothetical protein